MAVKRYVTCDGCGKETTDSERDDWCLAVSNTFYNDPDTAELFYDLCCSCAEYLKRVIKTEVKNMQKYELDDNGFDINGN